MDFFGSFKPNLNFINDVPERDIVQRLADTMDSLKISSIDFPSHGSHEHCWWTLQTNFTDTIFAYSDLESNAAGVIFTLQSIAGSILNFLLILALLRNPKIRKECLTLTIVSITITNFIWCVYVLPIMSMHFFAG